jgi:sarcosine oxidase subunit alpha
MARAPGGRLSYRGRVEEARPGETLLEVLSRRGLPTLVRSNRYHRPRAPFCGVGQCTGCLVRVNGRPGVRACRHLPGDGDEVESESGWPSPRLDALGAIDFLFPSGIDTLHGLRRPAAATPLFQRVVRRLWGTGELASEEGAASLREDPDRRSADVVVIGGGRSGRLVTDELVRAGIRPLVIDRALTSLELPGADVLSATSVTYLPPPRPETPFPFTLLGFSEPGRGLLVHARSVVVATGGYDAALLFGGNDRPGVLTAEAALSLARSERPPVFRRGVVVGGGRRARELLEQCGARIAAVVAPGEIRPEVVRAASELEIPLYPRSLVLYTTGRSRVRRLHLRARARGPRFSLDCDAVVLAHRRLPHAQLLFQAGARMEWNDGRGAYFPRVDSAGATTVPGLYAIGSVTASKAESDLSAARRTARAVVERPAPTEPAIQSTPTGPSEMVGYYRELANEPRSGKWMACLCEDVLLEEVERTVRAGYRGIEVMKRYTGLGSGLCQGRYCLADTLILLSILEDRPPPEVGYITQRPPVFPTPLAAFADLLGSFAPEADP